MYIFLARCRKLNVCMYLYIYMYVFGALLCVALLSVSLPANGEGRGGRELEMCNVHGSKRGERHFLKRSLELNNVFDRSGEVILPFRYEVITDTHTGLKIRSCERRNRPGGKYRYRAGYNYTLAFEVCATRKNSLCNRHIYLSRCARYLIRVLTVTRTDCDTQSISHFITRRAGRQRPAVPAIAINFRTFRRISRREIPLKKKKKKCGYTFVFRVNRYIIYTVYISYEPPLRYRFSIYLFSHV